MEAMMKGLCLAYQARLQRYSLRVASGDAHIAEEAVQESLLRVWQSCHLFATEALYGWIAVIVRNATLDLLAARARRATEPIEDDEGRPRAEVERSAARQAGPHADAHTMAPDAALEREEGMRLLLVCMARFERDHPAHALALRCAIQGLDGAEMAATLHRTPGATRELLRTARLKAPSYLAEWLAFVRPGEAGVSAPGATHPALP
jgi:DNA-directed RNA polymerase specialized sigma24 family protein